MKTTRASILGTLKRHVCIAYLFFFFLELNGIHQVCDSGLHQRCLAEYIELGGAANEEFLLVPCPDQLEACKKSGILKGTIVHVHNCMTHIEMRSCDDACINRFIYSIDAHTPRVPGLKLEYSSLYDQSLITSISSCMSYVSQTASIKA